MKKFLLTTLLTVGACAPPVFQDIDMSMYKNPPMTVMECSSECSAMVGDVTTSSYIPSPSARTYTITYPGYERSSGIITGKPFWYQTSKTATITVK